MIEAATSLAGLGWSPIPIHTPSGDSCSCDRSPCGSPGKHPRIAWRAFEAQIPTPGQILGWWRRWPDANVGVITGAGLAVIDVDPRAGGDSSLAEWSSLPETVETITGGGGRHLWFSTDGHTASRVLGDGLELKAEGGLVVAPPSLHASGERYRWREDHSPWERDLAPLPTELATPAHEPSEDRPADPPRTHAEQAEFADAWAGTGVELEPGDRTYLCPFHDDHHPSLHIDADGCRWYCFGCRRGGGIGRLRRLLDQHGPARRPERLERVDHTPVTVSGRIEVEVVGESRHQDELFAITGGVRRYGGVDVETTARLFPEPHNPRDRAAVAVEIDGLDVGYLRHADAVAYRRIIDEASDLGGMASCRARIRGGWDRGHGDVGAFGVTLWLPPTD